jgi:hypothetical protein
MHLHCTPTTQHYKQASWELEPPWVRIIHRSVKSVSEVEITLQYTGRTEIAVEYRASYSAFQADSAEGLHLLRY